MGRYEFDELLPDYPWECCEADLAQTYWERLLKVHDKPSATRYVSRRSGWLNWQMRIDLRVYVDLREFGGRVPSRYSTGGRLHGGLISKCYSTLEPTNQDSHHSSPE